MGSNIPGATNTSLSISNVQPSQTGPYSVVITNIYGSVTSSVAYLGLGGRPSEISLPTINASGGQAVSLPVTLAANGNENALSFSLLFNPSLLAYSNAVLAQDLFGAGMLVDTSQANNGRLGFAIVLESAANFPPGTQEIIQVGFTTAVLTDSVVANVSFSDNPIPRQLSDPQGNALLATYTDGAVDIAFVGLEGDVFPRPNGNAAFSVNDWALVGQYAARLEYPTNQTEFQRADCAPRGTMGDGAITVADWVQVGRYVLGLDPIAPLGGPVSEVLYSGPGPSSTRSLTAGTANLTPDQISIVNVKLASQGDENALGFNLQFDPTRASFSGANPGIGASGATMYVNTNEAGSGQVGFVLSLNPGSAFTAGTSTVVQVSFQAAPSTPGAFAPGFANYPVIPEICDSVALALPVSFIDGSTATNLLPQLSAHLSGQTILISWPSSTTNFILQETTGQFPLLPLWTNSIVAPLVSNGQQMVTFPVGPTNKFFRLYQP